LGSAAGLTNGLRGIGKTAYVLENPETTPRYQAYVSPYLAPPGFAPQTTLSVDTADTRILAANACQYAQRVDLSIDHHASNTGYAKFTCLEPALSSCGELVYDILIALSGEISAGAAEPLYVALSTDTGCFQYANVTANSLQVGAALIEAGADHRAVNKKLFRTKSRGRMALDGALYTDLRYDYDGRAATGVLTLELMERCGVTEDDLDDIAAIPNLAEGVQVGIVVRELEDGSCKASVRTSPGVDAGEICGKFGGGGHSMAAGCLVGMSPEDTAAALIKTLGELFKKSSPKPPQKLQ